MSFYYYDDGEVEKSRANKDHPFKNVVDHYGFIRPYDSKIIEKEIKNRLIMECEKNCINIDLIENNTIDNQVKSLLNVFEIVLFNIYTTIINNLSIKNVSVYIDNGLSTSIINETINDIFNDPNDKLDICMKHDTNIKMNLKRNN